MSVRDERIMVIGALGQVGTDLTPALRSRYGAENVVAVGRRTMPTDDCRNAGPFEFADATDKAALRALLQRYKINTIYHLAAIMSAAGEQDPELAWRVNMESLRNVLDLGVELGLDRIFWPSSIAVFGPTTPRQNTPQSTVLEPTTIYGVTKVAGELLCNYFFIKHGLDVRSVRYPGLVTYKTFSGGGTSDYSIEIFIEALKHRHYTCFVSAETTMPMMYMDDAVRATIELMNADADRLTVRTSYNVAAESFTAGELASEVARRIDGFTYDFMPDYRQAIADSWPDAVDDSVARHDWDWSPDYDLTSLSQLMLKGMGSKLGIQE